MLEVKDGKIYVEGVETNDAELIGFAFLDYAEKLNSLKYDFNSKYIEPISESVIKKIDNEKPIQTNR